MTRPTIYAPVDCGHCFESLDYEDWWSCPKCRITWPSSNPYDDVEPQFTHADDEPCGDDLKPNPRTGEVDGQPFEVTYSDCWLPLGHTSKHDYDETYTFGPKP